MADAGRITARARLTDDGMEVPRWLTMIIARPPRWS
ncbi:hypothetical protein BMS3Abin12_00964 [bacterium BMS3Abin12]|nr:hypothetical protein BMS3Abin12_00964 [bacterium BMS3Abin12]